MTAAQTSTTETVRQLVDRQLHLTAHGVRLRTDDDLWDLGMTSLTCLGLMLSIEEAFDIELPEELLREATFRSIDTIATAVESMVGSALRPAEAVDVPAHG